MRKKDIFVLSDELNNGETKIELINGKKYVIGGIGMDKKNESRIEDVFKIGVLNNDTIIDDSLSIRSIVEVKRINVCVSYIIMDLDMNLKSFWDEVCEECAVKD